MKDERWFPMNPRSYTYLKRLELGWSEVVIVLLEWAIIATGFVHLIELNFYGAGHMFIIAAMGRLVSQYRWAWRVARAVLRDTWAKPSDVR